MRAKQVGKPVAGKTGTTNDSRDAWFMGFSPDLVVGVYIGYDSPQTLGDKETGGRVALPAFIEFMKTALKDTPARGFRIPRGIQKVRIDRKTGIPAYAGVPADAQIISEAFISDYASIFRPESEGGLGDTRHGDAPIQYSDPEALEQWQVEQGVSAYDAALPETEGARQNPQPYALPQQVAPQRQTPLKRAIIQGGYPREYDPRQQQAPVSNSGLPYGASNTPPATQGVHPYAPNAAPDYQEYQQRRRDPARRGISDTGGTGGLY